MADRFPEMNRNRWDAHHRLLSEEILSSCFSLVKGDLTYGPPTTTTKTTTNTTGNTTGIVDGDDSNSMKGDLTYSSMREGWVSTTPTTTTRGVVDNLTYRSSGRRVRMSTVKSAVRSTIRYKLFETRTAALNSIATTIQAIHTSDNLTSCEQYHNHY